MSRHVSNSAEFLKIVASEVRNRGGDGYSIGVGCNVNRDASGEYRGFFEAKLCEYRTEICKLQEPVFGEKEDFDRRYLIEKLATIGTELVPQFVGRHNVEINEGDLTLRFSPVEREVRNVPVSPETGKALFASLRAALF